MSDHAYGLVSVWVRCVRCVHGEGVGLVPVVDLACTPRGPVIRSSRAKSPSLLGWLERCEKASEDRSCMLESGDRAEACSACCMVVAGRSLVSAKIVVGMRFDFEDFESLAIAQDMAGEACMVMQGRTELDRHSWMDSCSWY